VSEADYRALAVRATDWLADPARRTDAPAAVPVTVERVEGALAVAVGVGRREVELYPVAAGRVLEGAATVASPGGLEAAVASLDWPATEGPDDWPWLAAWIGSARGRGSYVSLRAVGGRGGLAVAIRSGLPARFADPSGGGNVGTSQGEA
jgi:hypothetical protein